MNPAVLLSESQTIKEELIEIRRTIHAHAETGFKLQGLKNM